MAGIRDDIVKAIIDRAKIEDVVGDYVKLKKKGVRYLGLCPFHEDKNIGSFVVYPRKNCYKCFACDAKGGPVEFVKKYLNMSFPDAIRYLGKKYNIETDVTDFNYTPPPPKPAPPPLPMLILPMGMVRIKEVIKPAVKTAGVVAEIEKAKEVTNTEKAKEVTNTEKGEEVINTEKAGNLVRWIMNGVKWDRAARARIVPMLKDYHIGVSKHGHTIFWQIDNKGCVRTGKMMMYKTDGHRDKTSSWNFDFVHSALFRDKRYPQYDEEKQELKQTLFGMHLLNKYGCGTVNIVESEKTALLMAIAYGNNLTQVWMACGGLENLTRERLAPIISARRNIVLYPDRDGVDKWRAKAAELAYDRISINAEPVLKWWRESDGEKADIADVVIRIINEHTPMKTIEEVAEKVPPMKPMINKLGLEITDDE